MNIETMLFLIVVGCCLWAFSEHLKLRSEVKRLRHELATLAPASAPAHQPAASEMITADVLPGAGQALKSPPTSLQNTLAVLTGAYAMPLGWSVVNGKAELVAAHLKGDVNHVLLTGQSDSGKDNAALNMLLSLAATHTPQQCQFAIVDGKGLDWISWQNKAHCWHLAIKPEDIADAMQKLTAERLRRYDRLASVNVKKWDSYTGDDMPLLVVFVSELLLLQNAVGKAALTSWLNAELTSARAAGIRYVIATQTASQFDTQWRSQISLFLGGYQPLDSQDKPNTGMTANELSRLGAIAPSNLPPPATGAGGVFVAIQGANALNVRTSLLSDDHAEYVLKQLPNKPASKPAAARRNDNDLLHEMLGNNLLIPDDYVLEDIGHSNAVEAHFQGQEAGRSVSGLLRSHEPLEALPVSTILVPESEQRRIIAAAKNATSRRQVCKELYNSTGGTGYKNIALVCDALGLLVPTSSAVVMQ